MQVLRELAKELPELEKILKMLDKAYNKVMMQQLQPPKKKGAFVTKF